MHTDILLFFTYLYFKILLIIITIIVLKRSNYRVDYNLINKELIIVIPCYKEQNIIVDTIIHFKKVFKNVKIVIITTDKENDNNINNTYEKVKDYIANTNDKNVYLVNYPFKDGYMADQLNYFLKNIKKFISFRKEYSDDNLYIALYNADSRPGKNSYNEISYYLNRFNYNVLQQYSYGFLNYEKINFLLKGFAIYQSNFEFKTGLLNGKLNTDILYKHVVGHGLVMNFSTLKKINYFNTRFWCEDIYMTMQLKTLGIK